MAQVASDLEENLLDKKDDEPVPDAEPVKSAFWTKFWLANSLALGVTLFYVPIVVPDVKQWFFVDMDLPTLLNSPDFAGYWPNTVQLIVFTVYFSTGSTVQLAWQGLAGTMGAGLNLFIMGKLFPVGGQCSTISNSTNSTVTEYAIANSTVNGIRGFCEEYVDPNYGNFWWFVWLDVFFFMFLVLSSNAKENTVKFGLSWHCTYMMLFMSKDGYKPSHAVNITSVFGVSLAILITLVPSFDNGRIVFKPHVVAKNLEGHPVKIARKVREISMGTVKFMLAKKPVTIEERYHFKVDKMAIVQRIEELEPMAGAMSSDHATSWWEGWLYVLNCGFTEFRMARTHCGIFAEAFEDDIGGFDDVAFIMKKVVTAMDVSVYKYLEPEDLEEVETERESLKGSLNALNDSSMSLLKLITSWKEAQEADQDLGTFAQRTDNMKKDCDGKFIELYTTYIRWTQDNPSTDKSVGRKVMRRNMTLSVFAVLQLASEVMDLADKVVEKYEKAVALTKSDYAMKALNDLLSQFKGTWISGGSMPAMFKACTDPEKRSFAYRNMVSIGLCFLLGNLLDGNVFTPYNSLMAGTLSVLISHFPGSAFYKNLMRLLGLAIGNALPIIMLAFCSVSGNLGPYIHLLMFFLFELYFGLMYYTSPEWSYIGCICAGFGCYSFTAVDWAAGTFEKTGYEKIGQATAAIAVQIIVDIVDTSLRRKFPSDIVVENMTTMINGGTDKSGARVDGVLQVFEKFETHLSADESDPARMDEIKASVKALKGIMASQEQLVEECKPKTTMIAGPKPAFKLDLYQGALAAIKEMLGEIDALCLVDEFGAKVVGNWQEANQGCAQWFDQQYKEFYGQVLENMRQTFETLMTIMTKADEGPVPKKQVKVCLMDDDGTQDTDTPGVRMTVVKRIIGDTFKHVLQIEQLCCSSGSLEFEI